MCQTYVRWLDEEERKDMIGKGREGDLAREHEIKKGTRSEIVVRRTTDRFLLKKHISKKGNNAASIQKK